MNQTRSQASEEAENIGRNPSGNLTIGDVIAARFDRRDLVKGVLGVAAIAATVSPLALAAASKAHADNMLNGQITSVGVGVAYSGNVVYVAEEFMG